MWYYLSFVVGEKWAGACWVQAPNDAAALKEAHYQGCNPGGEVLAIPEDVEPPIVNRLITDKEELERITVAWKGEGGKCKTLGQFRDENPGMDIQPPIICEHCNEGE